jgi:hypothetical protein
MSIFRSVTTLAVLFAATAVSHAQYVVLPPPPGPVVNYSYYPPPAPTFVAPAPAVSYSYYPAPAPVFAPAPAVSYYAAPAVSYYPGTYVTRTYTGFGIFRPRGTYTESYYRPW